MLPAELSPNPLPVCYFSKVFLTLAILSLLESLWLDLDQALFLWFVPLAYSFEGGWGPLSLPERDIHFSLLCGAVHKACSLSKFPVSEAAALAQNGEWPETCLFV